MTEKSVESIVDELRGVQNLTVLSEEKKQFLLTDEQVLDAIVSGLLKDFKNL